MRCRACGKSNPLGHLVCGHCGKRMDDLSHNARPLYYLLSCIFPPIGLFISMTYHEMPAPEDKRLSRTCLISAYIGFGMYIGIAVYILAERGVV
jgi:hypothetical protein